MSNTELQYKNRPLTVKLSDGQNYIVTHLHGDEAISKGAQFTLSIVSNAEVTLKNLANVAHICFDSSEGKRDFSGLCSSLQFTGYNKDRELYFYQVVVADPLYFLSFRRSRQIFQNMTTKQIIEKVIADAGLKSYFTFGVSGNGKQHEYCVQLDEDDQAFLFRLLSQEGWHFHVRHASGKPVVYIGDSNQRFEKIAQPDLSYHVGGNKALKTISTWSQLTQVGTAAVSFCDHNQPQAEIFDSGERKSTTSFSPSGLNQQLFGYGQDTKAESRDAAKRQMEALDLHKSLAQSTSDISQLSCGYKFKLTNHPLSSLNQEYVVVSVTHSISSDEGSSTVTYHNQFSCIPSSTTFRPEIVNKPRVHSLHTATVCGPKNEEIYRDKGGAIKVQFHWDQVGKGDENASCWLPVSQSLASKGFGAQFTPRVGDEVIVQYIDGDPDRPVITGSLYNKNNTAPYSSATQSGIKTRTTPKGSSKQGNELRFEDQKDKEHVYLHAEKDYLLDINNDSQTTIKGQKKTQVDKAVALSAKENISAETDKDFSTKSKGNWSGDSDKSLKLNAGSDVAIQAKSSVSIDGSSISLAGKSSIELKVGGSKISISAGGIKIEAPQVSVAGQGKAELKGAIVNVEGSGKTDVKGTLVTVNGNAMTQVKAGGMVQIQGAIAKVN